MSSQTSSLAPGRPGRMPLNKVVTHHNGVLFHAVTLASFLEMTALVHANALAAVFAFDGQVCRWLQMEWGPAKAARGQALRGYVESAWDGFDWSCAYSEFYAAYRPRVTHGYGERRGSQVALALCATAAQTAACYRGLAAYADDPELRRLLHAAAEAEACKFDWFRALFERLDRARPLSTLASFRIVVRAAVGARDGAVRLAFMRLAPNWCGRPPFPEMDYPLFLQRTGAVLGRYLTPDLTMRILFRPWLKATGVTVAEVPRMRQPDRRAASHRELAAA